MSAAWIKIEVITPDKPEVVAMAAKLRKDQDLVTGKLVRLWCWADLHSVGGEALPITRRWIDQHVRVKGFAGAMESAGWLEGNDGELRFPHFERHNGNSAKRRSETQRRVQKHRKRNADVTPDSLPKALPEREREGDKKGNVSAQAQQVVNAYPRRESVEDALTIVAKHLEAGESFSVMISGTRAIAAVIRELPSGHLNRYVPSARKFFAGKRWNDDPQTFRRQAEKGKGSELTKEELAEQLGGRVSQEDLAGI